MNHLDPRIFLLSVESSKIVTGTTSLLNDIAKALLIIAPVLAVVVFGYCAIRKMMADDHEVPMLNKRMVGIFIALALVFCASAIIALVTSYYK